MTKDTLSQIRERADKFLPYKLPFKLEGAEEAVDFFASAQVDIPDLLAYVEKLERVAEAAKEMRYRDVEGKLTAALRGLEE